VRSRSLFFKRLAMVRQLLNIAEIFIVSREIRSLYWTNMLTNPKGSAREK